ncbi:hypothetical protein TVAG_434080 [Trichomonas vaginalis G3]|uniref:Uncharacterized protein n=1 Tax=Trichomonas vaginalis (strain ATCC PRA-98 / G3) TaxID=412133 RepID=A2DSJ1_TRIV3|nr:coiled-coil domain-containing protein 151 family [Trichomonas vaginalis G3]EAY16571.1 hypothetical protein TVAG_434080 [Trichomonas vaginalis G3]KAI5532940.1 coiled-coil domain-containing protein 151 family [Trichomonas vaginalis G3]|eukprot:XP_001328794.1 hypothetical protein [Trichomonas vaginalis G3]
MKKQEEEKPNIAETFESDLASIKEKGRDLKGTDRDFYNSIVQRLENNEQVLSDLRKEHTQLRSSLAVLTKEKQKRTGSIDLHADIKHSTHQVNLLKKQIDNYRHKKQEAVKRQTELQIQLQNLEGGSQSTDTTTERIQTLKNRLDNAEIKNNETKHLLKIYNAIIYQFQRQKMQWNRLIEAQKKEIEQKKRDLADLELIARDSVHSMNAAKLEYNNLQAKTAAAREKREQQLKAKTAQYQANLHQLIMEDSNDARQAKPQQSLNSQASVVRNRNNRAQKDKKDEKFRTVSSKYEEIVEYFGTGDPDAIVKFFEDRRNTSATLTKQIEDLKAVNDQLSKEVAQKRSAIDEAEYTSHKGVGGNRLLQEAKKILLSENEKLQEAEKEKLASIAFKESVVSGIYHLADEMQLVQKEPLNANSPTEVLDWIKEMITTIKPKLEDEDYDFMQICNAQVVASKIAAENNFDIRETESSKRITKPNKLGEVLKQQRQKGDKGEFVSRVMDRNATKAMAQRIAQQKAAEIAAKKKKM